MIAALLHPFRWLRIFFQVATGSQVTGLPAGANDPFSLDEEMDPDWDGDWNEEEIEID